MPYPNHDFVWRCFIWTGEGVLYHWITIKSPWNPIKLPWNQRYQHLSTLNHPSFPYISIYLLVDEPPIISAKFSTITFDGTTPSPRLGPRQSSQPCRQQFLRPCRPFHSWVAIRRQRSGAERSGAEILWKSYGNPMEILWKSYGNPMEILWKSLEMVDL